jgi:hypothetical protein
LDAVDHPRQERIAAEFGEKKRGLPKGRAPRCWATSRGQTYLANRGRTALAEPAAEWIATQTGVISLRSEVRIADIADGTSNTLLVAEKYKHPALYEQGHDPADDMSMFQGYDWDTVRIARPSLPPLRDGSLPVDDQRFGFGGPHPTGLLAAFCDGSARPVNYSIDLEAYRRLANREDGLPASRD